MKKLLEHLRKQETGLKSKVEMNENSIKQLQAKIDEHQKEVDEAKLLLDDIKEAKKKLK
ncbi:hypothetical protein [Bacteroides graminisolvens]|uniref:hypothetical protein n=1 Tax=Bacteroides graminisolvens TaxID=477666 RepID=UPI002409370F|nr:hypothetical protein [Bacteroides graminisolvens]